MTRKEMLVDFIRNRGVCQSDMDNKCGICIVEDECINQKEGASYSNTYKKSLSAFTEEYGESALVEELI